MHKHVMAARAAANPTVGLARGTGIYTGPLTVVPPPRQSFRNRSATKMTGAQRDSRGRRSDWSRSPYAPRGGWR